ncbi:hypothetical protein N9B82_01610 [Saprospiraceae bacterium]|nr:hypothetical protein [Saprospiraceae bacterium]
MKALSLVLFLCSTFTSLAQTPKTEGLIVVAPRTNVLYNRFKNPILINQSFDSLSTNNGEVSIENNTIFIQPSELGRLILFMHFDGDKAVHFFNVKDIDIKPTVAIPNASHSRWGKLQDKTRIYAVWWIDFDVKTTITSFVTVIEKLDGEILTIENETGRFNKQLISAIELLEAGDILRFEKVKCFTSNGMELFAENYRIVVK